jgi:cell division protein DivIC
MRAAIPAWLRNKYLLTTILFVCWMLFFDHNDLFTQVARSRELSDLKTGVEYYRKEIHDTRKQLEDYRMDPASMEKIAREKYLMRRDNETVFIISKEK